MPAAISRRSADRPATTSPPWTRPPAWPRPGTPTRKTVSPRCLGLDRLRRRPLPRSAGRFATTSPLSMRPPATPPPGTPTRDGGIGALAVSGSTVYAGGDFASIGGATRNHIAAVDATTRRRRLGPRRRRPRPRPRRLGFDSVRRWRLHLDRRAAQAKLWALLASAQRFDEPQQRRPIHGQSLSDDRQLGHGRHPDALPQRWRQLERLGDVRRQQGLEAVCR